MNAKLTLKQWDQFEGPFQDAITSYLCRCSVDPAEVLTAGEDFKVWHVCAVGLSLIYRLDCDSSVRLALGLEVCVGRVNQSFDVVTREFLLAYNRGLFDYKICVSKEGNQIIGTFAMFADDTRPEAFKRIVDDLTVFGEHLKTVLKPFQILPIASSNLR